MQAAQTPTAVEDKDISGIIAELQATTPMYEMQIDGNAYVCPPASMTTVKEYDAWIDYVKSHPTPVVPADKAKRPRKARQWLRMAHYVRRASFAGYWWGIPKDIAILLPAEQMEAMAAAALMTYCPITIDASPSIQIGKDTYTASTKALSEIDLRLVICVRDFLTDILVNEYGEKPSQADVADIPLDKAFVVLRSIASLGNIGRQGSRTNAKNFLASIVYTF